MGKRGSKKNKGDGDSDYGREPFPSKPYEDQGYYEAMNYIVSLGIHIKGEKGDSFPILKEMVNSIFGNRDPEKTLFSEEMAESLARKACLFLIDAVDEKHNRIFPTMDSNDDDEDSVDSDIPGFPHLPI